MSDLDPIEEARKKSRKRPREHLNCNECYRRKQKCDRQFPCGHCVARKVPERCFPPTSEQHVAHKKAKEEAAGGGSGGGGGGGPSYSGYTTHFPSSRFQSGGDHEDIHHHGPFPFHISSTTPSHHHGAGHLAGHSTTGSGMSEPPRRFTSWSGDSTPQSGIVPHTGSSGSLGGAYPPHHANTAAHPPHSAGPGAGVSPANMSEETRQLYMDWRARMDSLDHVISPHHRPNELQPPSNRQSASATPVHNHHDRHSTDHRPQHDLDDSQKDTEEYLAENGYNGPSAMTALTRASFLNESRASSQSGGVGGHGGPDSVASGDEHEHEPDNEHGHGRPVNMDEQQHHHHHDARPSSSGHHNYPQLPRPSSSGRSHQANTSLSRLTRRHTAGATSKPSFFTHRSLVSSSLDKLLGLDHFRNQEIRLVFQVLPSVSVCEGLINSYFHNWDWTRYPLPPSVFPQDWRTLLDLDTCIHLLTLYPHDTSKNRIATLALLIAVLALGSINRSLLSSDDHQTSTKLLWAANQVIAYCQTHASEDSKVLWARTIIVRYTDMARNTQATWSTTGAMVRHAIDQGLHRDGSSFSNHLSQEAIAERRVLWSHMLHDDREWALILGRPLSIHRWSTRMPSEEDLREFPWDVRQYLLARNDLIPYVLAAVFTVISSDSDGLTRALRKTYRLMAQVSDLFQDFQDLDAPAHLTGLTPAAHAARKQSLFAHLFSLDDALTSYLTSLSSVFSIDSSTINYATESRYPRLKVYRQVIIGQVYFIRILLNRPFMLNARRNAEGAYGSCWRRCVDAAVRDLRLRNMWRLTLSESEQVGV